MCSRTLLLFERSTIYREIPRKESTRTWTAGGSHSQQCSVENTPCFSFFSSRVWATYSHRQPRNCRRSSQARRKYNIHWCANRISPRTHVVPEAFNKGIFLSSTTLQQDKDNQKNCEQRHLRKNMRRFSGQTKPNQDTKRNEDHDNAK